MSPLEEAKKAMVELCIQMGTIRQPLTLNKGIELMNSLIAKTDLQDNVKNFNTPESLATKTLIMERLAVVSGMVS